MQSPHSFRIRLPNYQIDQIEGEEEDVTGYDANGVQAALEEQKASLPPWKAALD